MNVKESSCCLPCDISGSKISLAPYSTEAAFDKKNETSLLWSVS